jgi:hypothetical protein
MYRKSKYLPVFIIALALLFHPVESEARQSAENNIVLGPAVAQIFDNDNVLYIVAEFRHYFNDNGGGVLTSLEIFNDTYYVAVGLFRERRLFDELYCAFGLSPGLVSGEGEKKLGCVVEFRSSIEIFYRFANNHRLGLSVNHYSNSGLGKINPGTESLRLMLSVPIS